MMMLVMMVMVVMVMMRLISCLCSKARWDGLALQRAKQPMNS